MRRTIRLEPATMLELHELTGISQAELEVRMSQAKDKGNVLYFSVDIMWTAYEVGDPLKPVGSRNEQGM